MMMAAVFSNHRTASTQPTKDESLCSIGTPAEHISFEAGLRTFVANESLTVLPGCDVWSADASRIAAVAAAARTADAVLHYLGLDGSIENEGQDRPIAVGLGLPGQQERLLAAVSAAEHLKGVRLSLVHPLFHTKLGRH